MSRRSPALVAVGLALAVQSGTAQQMSAVESVRPLYEMARGFIHRAAEQMPEVDYGFKPTPEVRSFGQLLGHIADGRYMFCSMASGEANPKANTNHEQLATKAALIQALNQSAAYCDQAYAISDARAMESLEIFGRAWNRLGALAFNATHDWEHYGNIVTYLRLKGMVPPSSQRGGL
jgi:uncharacterized damage-inducible protein DinB